MDNAKEFINTNIFGNCFIKLIWAFLVITLLLYIVFGREKFLGEFRQAPLAVQRPPALLGNGNYARFASEFSSTNQGGDNLTAGNNANYKEHLVGAMEPPVIQSSTIPAGLSNWQKTADSIYTPGDEPFTSSSNFREPFASHDESLKQILRGN